MAGRRHAFLLACDDYRHEREYRKLRFAVDDARLLRDTLIKCCDFEPDDIIVETSSADDPVAPVQVLNALKRLVEGTEAGDTILFFFAGHGDESGGKAYIALPASTRADLSDTGVSLHDISDILRVRDRFCARIFDSCHSGIDARSVRTGEEAFARAATQSAGEGMYVTLAACEVNGQSYEDPDIQHGVFTACLCEAIRETPEGASIETDELYRRTYDKVVEASERKQRVQRPVKNSHFTGRGEIARRSVVPVQPEAAKSALAGNTALTRRLLIARQNEGRLVKNRIKELESIGLLAMRILQAENANLSEYAIEPAAKLGTTQLIPKEWHSKIVRHFEGLGAKSLHCIHSYQVDPTTFLGVTNFFGKKNTEYSISDYGLPKSVALLQWGGDDYVPSGEAMCYVIPLETKTYTLVALDVSSVIDSEEGYGYVLGGFVELEADWEAILRPAITEAIKICTVRIENSIRARLDYQDRERTF